MDKYHTKQETQHDDCKIFEISEPVTACTSYCSSDKSAKPASNEAWKKINNKKIKFHYSFREHNFKIQRKQWCLLFFISIFWLLTFNFLTFVACPAIRNRPWHIENKALRFGQTGTSYERVESLQESFLNWHVLVKRGLELIRVEKREFAWEFSQP